MRPSSQLPRNALTLVDATRLKLLHLMALALYEHDAPMTYEEIRERLREVGVDREVSALQKAWHGRPLLRKSRDGRFHLDSEDAGSDWHWVELVVSEHLGLGRRAAAGPALSIVPPPQRDRGADAPLTPDEAALAVRHGSYPTMTLRRRLIALVDAARRPLAVDEAIRALEDAGITRTSPEDVERSLRGLPGPLRRDEDGRLALDDTHEGLSAIRAMARKIAASARVREEADEQIRRIREASDAREADERAKRQAWYATANKVVLRALFDGNRLVAAAVLDPDTRAIEFYEDAAGVRTRLASADLVLGLDPWSDLTQLDVSTRGRTLVDLSPPNKTRTLNRRGRTLRVTPSLLMAGTLEVTNPLGDDVRLREQLVHAKAGAVRRRLEADLKSLWRFYDYGRLHGFVRLRWGFLDEHVGVNWNVGGLPTIREILRAAIAEDGIVEIVLGAAPGWADPWSRARTCRVVDVDWHHARFEGHGGPVAIGFEEIAAVRRG